MTVALIMAGGQSSRMRSEDDAEHKALRRVCGAPMIERNIAQMLAAGLRDIYVAVNASETSIQEFVAQRGQALVARADGKIQCLLEHEPLGTIGIAQKLGDLNQNVLVQNVDNLTTLCFRSMVQQHQASEAAMTIATHVEGFTVPLGEVVIEQGQIVDYREKPIHPVNISSGAYVLAPGTCRLIQPAQRIDVPALIPMLREKQEKVLAFPHESAWIDVNDKATLLRAEQLIQQHKREFENEFLLIPTPSSQH